ncbi:MAG: VWA domain-containing protein, partial [Cyanobacteria bacterium J06559_3]
FASREFVVTAGTVQVIFPTVDLGGYSIANDVQIENATASDGDDFLIGNEFDNTLIGNGGEDYLHGASGDDELSGGEGDDELAGGRGDDTLDGGDGNNDRAIFIGNYADEYTFTRNEANGTITVSHEEGAATDGTDTLQNIETAVFQDESEQLATLVDLTAEEVRFAQQAKVLDVDGKDIGSLALEVPVNMFDGYADYTVTLSTVDQNAEYNFALIIDRSFSMGNGPDSPLADAKNAYISLIDALIEQGIAASSRFAVIPFDSDASLQGPFGAEEAKSAISALSPGGNTDFGPPITEAINFFSGLPSGANNIAYFLSDGSGSGASDALQASAEVRAYGIGGANLTQLDIIDSDDAVFLEDSSDLAEEFATSGISKEEISKIEIFLEDQLIDTILPDQLIDSALGLTFDGSIEGLNVDVDITNKVSAKISFVDPARPPATVDNTIDSAAISFNKPPKQGTDGDDVIAFDAVTIDIDAGAGNDEVIGNVFDNTINGGAGNDILNGEIGNDVFITGSGSDRGRWW